MHIQKFVDRVRGLEARAAKDFIMSMQDAKDLHADITKLLITLHDLQQQQVISAKPDLVQTVKIDGGQFK